MKPFMTRKNDISGLFTLKNLNEKKIAIGNIAKIPNKKLKPFLITYPFD